MRLSVGTYNSAGRGRPNEFDTATPGAEGIEKRLELLAETLTREPSAVHQAQLINILQFVFEALEQSPRAAVKV